jgi:photosystem II stability/assembly factor-like uncharacterized protein
MAVMPHGIRSATFAFTAAVVLLAAGCEAGHGTAVRPAPSIAPTASTAPTVAPSSSPGPTPTILTSPIPLPTNATIAAPSRGVVWAFVADIELFRSTDGGDTWLQRPLPAHPGAAVDMSFADDRNGWLVTHRSQAGQCEGYALTIWHTVDAGATWRPLGASGIGDARCKSELSFVDPTHGFLVGEDDNGPPVIYRTADGGETWTASRPLPVPPGFANPPGHVRQFGRTLLIATRQDVFRSTDGGVTWTHVASAPAVEPPVTLVTATRWLELGGADSQETLDAGAIWHGYGSDYGSAAPIAPSVVFGDAQVGYATVRGELQRTLDGGLHWSRIHMPGTAPAE